MNRRIVHRWTSAVWVMVLVTGGAAWGAAGTRPAASGPATQATATASAPAGQIEFTEETLENGLRVIYAPVQGGPMVDVVVAYHVGSKDDPPHCEGLANLLQNMMFEGSAHTKPGEHLRAIGRAGGGAWGWTYPDFTMYLDSLPSSQLELALYLEADRMVSLQVVPERLQIAKGRIAQEWREQQGRYGDLWAAVTKAAFPHHGYGSSMMGDMDQVAAVTAEDLLPLHRRYCVPNNAVLAIAGEVDIPAARQLVKKYFGWIPRGKPIQRGVAAETVQTELRRIVSFAELPMPYLSIAYRLPGLGSDDLEALNILTTILADGRYSRIVRLVSTGESPICRELQGYLMPMEETCLFAMYGWVDGLFQASRVEAAAMSEVAKIQEGQISPQELARAKAICRREILQNRSSAGKLAMMLAWEACLGDLTKANTHLNRLMAVSDEDVQAAARKYLRPENCTIVLVQPAGDRETAKRDAAASQPASRPVAEAMADVPAVVFPAGYPSRPPVSEALVSPDTSQIQKRVVGGMKVIVVPDHRVPLVNASLLLKAGSLLDPPGQAGLAELTVNLISRGCKGVPVREFQEDLDARGITLKGECGESAASLQVSCGREQLDYAMDRLRAVLLKPAFDDEGFARKHEFVEHYRYQTMASVAAMCVLHASLFEDSPLGVAATPESVAVLDRVGVMLFRRQYYVPTDATLFFAGDITIDKAVELAEGLLQDWPAGKPEDSDLTPVTAPQKRRIILVNSPKAVQSTIVMGMPACGRDSQEWEAADVASQMISWRLDVEVRSETGLVHQIRAAFCPRPVQGEFAVTTETAAESTGLVLGRILKVLEDLRSEPCDAKELRAAKEGVLGELAMMMARPWTPGQMGADFHEMSVYLLDRAEEYSRRVKAVTAKQVQEVLAKYADPGRMTIVVVGPSRKIRKQLEAFGEVEVQGYWAVK